MPLSLSENCVTTKHFIAPFLYVCHQVSSKPLLHTYLLVPIVLLRLTSFLHLTESMGLRLPSHLVPPQPVVEEEEQEEDPEVHQGRRAV